MIYEFFVGSYGKEGEPGITKVRMDIGKHTLEKVYTCDAVFHPSYLYVNQEKQVLYAVSEQEPEGKVHAFRMEPEGLSLQSTLESLGSAPCHLSMNPKEDMLYVANYTSGSLAVCSTMPEGYLKEVCELKQHKGHGINPERQEGPHVHFSKGQGQELFVVDLGLDQVAVYCQNEEGELLRDTKTRLLLPPGSGPRHLAFSPDIFGVVYVLCELSSQVAVFQKDGEGNYRRKQLLNALPKDFQGESTSAAIRVSGNLVFASNRGHDSIAVFRIQSDGSLMELGIHKTGGRTPRDFEIFGEILVVANQDSDLLTLLSINRQSGELTQLKERLPVIRPCCICGC